MNSGAKRKNICSDTLEKSPLVMYWIKYTTNIEYPITGRQLSLLYISR